jgi:biotin carboxyl carrier protein
MTTHIRIGDRTMKVVLHPDGSVAVDGQAIAAEWRLLSPGVLSILLTLPDGCVQSFRCIADGAEAVVVDGQRIPYTVSDPRSLRATESAATASGPRPLKAPMPGRIVRVLVENGEQVEAGQGCVVIEAMKMQNELKAPRAGKVIRLAATEGETVASGATLLIVE